ncbi:MAG: tetratricopeptide repeat protein [Verrucomicrobiota bacterium]|nr:tetratricopeptide repeat protein [Verrucomicrobiota bacterium]
MKRTLIHGIILATMLSMLASAQDSETGTPGLKLSDRTEAERIQFLLQVASAYFAEDDFGAAIGAYERILEIDPRHQESRYIIGHVYINAKQYAKAEKILTQLVEEYPDDFKLRNNLAWLYATADDPAFRNGKKAILLAQEAMAIAPTDHHVWSTLAEAHYINGEYEKAYRAITHMASLAARFGTGITEESVESYNEQIRKCKRAWDTQKMIEGTDDEAEE